MSYEHTTASVYSKATRLAAALVDLDHTVTAERLMPSTEGRAILATRERLVREILHSLLAILPDQGIATLARMSESLDVIEPAAEPETGF